MRTYLVTGGAGFIGSNLVQMLLQSGHRVIVLDAFTYAANLQSLADARAHPAFHLIHGSIADAAALDRAFSFEPDGVLHLAAESHVDRSIDSPEAFIQTNVVGTYRLLETSLGYWRNRKTLMSGFRFLHVSTDEVFGSLGSDGYFSESSPYNPSSPYSATKAAADHLVRSYHRTYGLPIVITNCSNNYGPFQFPEKLIPHTILCCLKGLTIPVYGSGLHSRDWLHVSDHCQGLIAAMTAGKDGETYLFGTGQEHSTLEVVGAVCRVIDELRPRADGKSYYTQIEHVRDRPGHDWRCAIDASLSVKTLGWKPQTLFTSGITQTVRWYLDNPSWVQAAVAQGYLPTRQGIR